MKIIATDTKIHPVKWESMNDNQGRSVLYARVSQKVAAANLRRAARYAAKARAARLAKESAEYGDHDPFAFLLEN